MMRVYIHCTGTLSIDEGKKTKHKTPFECECKLSSLYLTQTRGAAAQKNSRKHLNETKNKHLGKQRIQHSISTAHWSETVGTDCSFCSLWSQIKTNWAVRHKAGNWMSTKECCLATANSSSPGRAPKKQFFTILKLLSLFRLKSKSMGNKYKSKNICQKKSDKWLIWLIICKEKKLKE